MGSDHDLRHRLRRPSVGVAAFLPLPLPLLQYIRVVVASRDRVFRLEQYIHTGQSGVV